MAENFSKTWKKSTQARKQHKFKHNAPLHVRQKMMHVHLSPDLRKSYGFRNLQVRKGDKIKVLSGHFKKKEGAVERVDLKSEKVYVSGIDYIKKDGTKVPLALHPSNLMIVELNLGDKIRKAKLESKKQSGKNTLKDVRDSKKVKEVKAVKTKVENTEGKSKK